MILKGSISVQKILDTFLKVHSDPHTDPLHSHADAPGVLCWGPELSWCSIILSFHFLKVAESMGPHLSRCTLAPPYLFSCPCVLLVRRTQQFCAAPGSESALSEAYYSKWSLKAFVQKLS